MNINYADIIEKANARKDALQNLEGLLSEFKEHDVALVRAIDYLRQLQGAVSRIDPEGRQLLGKVPDCIYYLHLLADRMAETAYENPGQGGCGSIIHIRDALGYK